MPSYLDCLIAFFGVKKLYTLSEEVNMSMHSEIEKLAYELYQRCGCVCGHELDHWLEAEKVVMAKYAEGKKEEEEIIEETTIEEIPVEPFPHAPKAAKETEIPKKKPVKKTAKKTTAKKTETKKTTRAKKTK